ncbi:MAG TPA: LamG-like jellyroll fold domain-containing protein, partial [Geobacteraceae bacterium]
MNALRSLMASVSMLVALITVPVTALAAIDTTQPTTSATLMGTKGSDGWYTTSVTVTLAAADGAGGSGVAKTEYSLDNVTWQTYSTPVVLDKDGSQYIYFRSTDQAGNVEAPSKFQEIKINKTGLVGLWHMDGDWKDASVVGNQGTPYSGVSFSSNSKVGTNAGSFNGSSSYVSVSDGPTIHGNLNQTVTGWIYVNSFNKPLQSIFYKGNAPECANKCDNREYALYLHSSGQLQLRSTPADRVGIGELSLNTPIGVIQTGDNGGWHHIAAVISSGQNFMKIYVNGQEMATTSYSTAGIRTTSGSLLIGNNPFWNGSFYGYIDEFSIYSRALSATEILEQYRNYVVKLPTVNPVTSPTATSVITLTGTKPANTAIVVNGNTLVPLNGTTTWQTTYNLSQGTNNLTITALDSQNFNSLPTTLMIVLDTTPPQVTTTTPINNGILKAAPGAVTFTLADALSPLNYTAILNGAKVTNASGSNIAGTWNSSGNGTTGSITFTPSAALSDGSYSATIKPTDTLGNGSNYTLTFTIDSTPPVAPGIDPVTAPINTTSKTITGTKSSDSASVAVSCAGAIIDTISYLTATTWSVNVSGL